MRKAVFIVSLVLTCAASGLAQNGCPVPELDPGSLSAAVTMLLGGLMILKDRRRR